MHRAGFTDIRDSDGTLFPSRADDMGVLLSMEKTNLYIFVVYLKKKYSAARHVQTHRSRNNIYTVINLLTSCVLRVCESVRDAFGPYT